MNLSELLYPKILVTSRIIGVLASIVFIIWLTYFALFGGNLSPIEFAQYYYWIILIVVIATLELVRRKMHLQAGIVFFCLSAVSGKLVSVYMNPPAWLIVGLPFLISGLLFIITWIVSKRRTISGK